MKKNTKFKWTTECEQAFLSFKEYLASPLILCKPEDVIREDTIVAALVKEEGQDQKLVYFVSTVLQGPKIRYQKIKKVAFALLTTARQLRHYF